MGCKGPGPVGKLEVAPASLELCYPCATPLTMRWLPLHALPERQGEPRVFLHLLDETGAIVRTFDHPYPDDWKPSASLEYSIELYQSALGDSLAPGKYTLTAGLYDSAGPERWSLEVAGEEIRNSEYQVATVLVADSNAQLRLGFSGGWQALEPGTDLQVLGRRWMSGDATITLSSLVSPGDLRLQMTMPDWVDELESDAAVELSATCEPQLRLISGAGQHTVVLSNLGHEGCEVQLRSHFELQEDAPTPGILSLERVTWTPSAGPAVEQ